VSLRAPEHAVLNKKTTLPAADTPLYNLHTGCAPGHGSYGSCHAPVQAPQQAAACHAPCVYAIHTRGQATLYLLALCIWHLGQRRPHAISILRAHPPSGRQRVNRIAWCLRILLCGRGLIGNAAAG
jgi:hypothetical protein